MTISTYSANGSVNGASAKREFSVVDEYPYNRKGPFRWIISHLLRYKGLLVLFLFAASLTNILFSAIPRLTGLAFDEVLDRKSVV